MPTRASILCLSSRPRRCRFAETPWRFANSSPNLVLNALDATRGQPEPAAIVVDLERLDEDRVALRVRDSGPGPAADVADRLFEPFVTTKAEGTGLGLYVVRRVAESHQGSITWERLDGKTCFSVVLPLLNPS